LDGVALEADADPGLGQTRSRRAIEGLLLAHSWYVLLQSVRPTLRVVVKIPVESDLDVDGRYGVGAHWRIRTAPPASVDTLFLIGSERQAFVRLVSRWPMHVGMGIGRLLCQDVRGWLDSA
jgi:hypothetical protein